MAQPIEFLPLVTSNERIRRVYVPNSAIPNVEYTLPVTTVAQYESPVVYDNPDVQRVIGNNLRVIVLPETYYRLDPEARKKVSIMSSPFECGRVLEADETVVIDGVDHTVNFKGVGATTMVRNGEIALTKILAFSDNLRRYPFFQGYGELDAAMARAESSGAIELRGRGVDTEKVLGIYKVTSMPDQNGEYTHPAVLRQEGILSKDTAILARASKSNFRLLDPVTMYERGLYMHIPGLREVAMEQFSKAEKKPADIETYLQFLTGKLFQQELPLIAEGYEMCHGGSRWRNLARNISVLGEELDLEALEPSPHFGSEHTIFDYAEHVDVQVRNLDNTIRAFADTITFDGPKVDFGNLAHFVWDGVSTALQSLDYEAILETMSSNIRRQLNFTGPDAVFRGIFKTIEGVYRHAVYLDAYNTPREQGAHVYKKAIVGRIQADSKSLFN